MDRDTRNLLANTTQALRRGLEEEFALQLEGTFDVLPDGSIADTPGPQLSDAEKFTRRKIVDAIQHHRAGGRSEQESVDAFIRETAFTFLNRLAALKMMEARGIVQECVSACDSHGFNARGFKEFGGLAPGLIEIPDGGYRLYLECIFDEIGREVGILFDRTDPASLLWPRRTALLEALSRINDPKLAAIWSEDETIGWIYQYYNDPEERRKMRDVKQGGSAAPRNSREMAVRNQFFTPRYVVEFLTDNALGRLWYEMTKGRTSLKDSCRYLIRRPVELFLPGPETRVWHDAEGIDAFRRFSASASPHDLPEDPVLGVLLGWMSHVKPDGFEPELLEVRRTHQEVIDEILVPLEQGRDSERLASAPSLELLHIIWRLTQGFHSGDYGIHTAPTSQDPVAGPVWKTLREKLLHPPENLSKEEQLRQPVFIPHRPLKDPRQIRMIDPACGSMHFGLYTFDLFEVIYREWSESVSLSPSPSSSSSSPPSPSPSNNEGETPSLPSHLFLNPHEEILKHRTNLPHWEQEAVTYFLTWRLADSLPKEKLDAWKSQRDLWLAANPKPWDEDTENDYHRRFSDNLDEWLDAGAGRCILRDPSIAAIVANALKHFDGQRYLLDCFVIMPNHVHALVKLAPDENLAKVLHSWKSFTAKEINRALGITGPVWQEDYFDRIVRNDRHLNACRTYIDLNPERAHLRDGYVLERSKSVPLSPPSSSPSPLNIEGETPSLLSALILEHNIHGIDIDPRAAQEGSKSVSLSPPPSSSSPLTEGETPSLLSLYPSKEALMQDVPRLILEHNIHGIDIDPRAAQIAGLALWLRAQRAWQEQGLRPADRPTVTRSNIVCAEPMPGEEDLLQRFINRSFPRHEQAFFSKLLGEIFTTMRLAGEAGSLLKIEENVSTLVADARAQWKKIGKQEGDFFSQAELSRLDKRSDLPLPLDTGSWSLEALSGIPDLQFWEKAEERIYQALRDFAESAGADGYQRRLFADDAARGFAFIDLCRQRYDVALMNPPFGDASLPSKSYLDDTYGDTKGDVYKAFVECFQARLVPAGFLGIISSRTGFFLGQSEDWRTRVVLRLFRPIALADLGMGVLDAMVEVAAYVLRSLSESETRDLTHSIVPMLKTVALDKQERFSLPKWQAARDGLKRHQAVAELEHLEAGGFIQRCDSETVRYSLNKKAVKVVTAPPRPVFPPLACIRALADEQKGDAILGYLHDRNSEGYFECDPNGFQSIPTSPFAYWASARMLKLPQRFPAYEPTSGEVKVGVQTCDDVRFVRLWWETSVSRSKWPPLLKGDTSSAFYADSECVLNWTENGDELKAFVTGLDDGGHWSRYVRSPDSYFKPGISWALRTAKFSPSFVPSGCIPSVSRYLALSSIYSLPAIVALWNSTVADWLCKLRMERHGHPKFIVGVVKETPFPKLTSEDEDLLSVTATRAWAAKRSLDSSNSISHAFHLPSLLMVSAGSVIESSTLWATYVREAEDSVSATQSEIEHLAFRLYGLVESDRAILNASNSIELDADVDSENEVGADESNINNQSPSLTADLLSYSLGSAFGRWDLRFATGEKPAPPEPDPFDPLPVCPPGMLQNADCLPATPADVPAAYPLRISWPGILVDDKGHDEDIEGRLREVFAVTFPDRTDEILHEACELLGVASLRDWFRKPAGFFAGHLKSHSKSRRQAPIYWPLSSPNGRYTIWLYYPRLTADTLFTVLRDYLEPKLQYEEGRAFRSRQEAGPTPAPTQRAEIAAADELVEDLRALRDELKRVAPLFKPDLNDGVILNHAPLWRMIALPKWRKDCQSTWEKLLSGDYDWAHLALHLWPERVIPNCATDRSLAIAHDLESTFWEEIPWDELPKAKGGRCAKKKAKVAEDEEEGDSHETPPTSGGSGKWRPKKVRAEDLQQLIATRTSPAVKAAVEALASAPTSGGAKKRAKKSTRK